MSLSQLLFDRESTAESSNGTKLLLLDDDGTNSRIKNPDATECPTRKCSTLTIYNNINTNTRYSDSQNNVDNNSNDNDHDFPLQDYYKSSVLTRSTYSATKRKELGFSHDISINNSNNAKNNDDNNSYSNNNDPWADSEDNNDNNKDGNFISASTLPPSNHNADNAPPGRNNKYNVMRLQRFIGHPNGIVFCVFKKKRSKSSVSQFDRSTVSVTKKPLGIMMRPSFISHPNGIVLHVFKQKRSASISSLLPNRSDTLLETSMEMNHPQCAPDLRIETDQQQAGVKQRSTEQRLSNSSMILRKRCTEKQPISISTSAYLSVTKRLSEPSFISHPNGIVLRVFKKQQSRIQKDQLRVGAKQRSPSSSVPSFIDHPNGIVFRVFTQKQVRTVLNQQQSRLHALK